MDAAKLAGAIDYATAKKAAGGARLSLRLPRGRGPARPESTRTPPFQSWSLAKSITSLVFGRAMTLGLVGPDDPLGSLIPAADRRTARSRCATCSP